MGGYSPFSRFAFLECQCQESSLLIDLADTLFPPELVNLSDYPTSSLKSRRAIKRRRVDEETTLAELFPTLLRRIRFRLVGTSGSL